MATYIETMGCKNCFYPRRMIISGTTIEINDNFLASN